VVCGVQEGATVTTEQRDRLAGIASKMRAEAGFIFDESKNHASDLRRLAAEIEACIAEPEAPQSVTPEAIRTVIADLSASFDAELFALDQAGLEENWFFAWSPLRSVAANLYQFYNMLRLYAGQCRRWEEHHNGSCCVVERVRDTYIMPKVREFADRLQVKPVEAPQPAPTVEAHP